MKAENFEQQVEKDLDPTAFLGLSKAGRILGDAWGDSMRARPDQADVGLRA